MKEVGLVHDGDEVGFMEVEKLSNYNIMRQYLSTWSFLKEINTDRKLYKFTMVNNNQLVAHQA